MNDLYYMFAVITNKAIYKGGNISYKVYRIIEDDLLKKIGRY